VSARAYRAAAPLSAGRIAAALGWAALTAAAVGVLAHAVTGTLFYVDVLVPAAIGVAVGAAMGWAVRRLALARPPVAGALAALAVMAALATMVALDFRTARAARGHEVDELSRLRADIGVSEEELAATRRAILAHWTLERYARARIGLDDSGMFTGTPPVLGRAGAVAMSLVELLLALAIAVLWAVQVAGEPACPRCGRWRVERRLGAAAHGVARALAKRLRAGDAGGAATLVRPPDTREQVLLSILTCPHGHDGEAGVLRIAEVSWTRRRRLALRPIADLEISATDLDVLRSALAEESAA
jgi:hypothetical protein